MVRAEASGTNNSKDINLENFDISYGEKVLIKGANVTLSYGRRWVVTGVVIDNNNVPHSGTGLLVEMVWARPPC